MDKLEMQTPNFTDENIEKLAGLFPNCVTESRDDKGMLKKAIDFDLLKQELSENIVDGPRERYQINWPGKKEALLAANTPINKTLRPCREESVDFDTTENLYIEGDNLEVLKLLQESYLGKIKMIYIDPPYNTGKDFVYNDNFTRSKEQELEASEQIDEDGGRLVASLESNGRFHSDWMSMIYPRLKLARNLLMDNGAIFISLDDGEIANLRKICDEIFGDGNFVGNISWKKTSGDNKPSFAFTHDNILIYGKYSDQIPRVPLTPEQAKQYKNPDNDNRGSWAETDYRSKWSKEERKNLYYAITNPNTGEEIYPDTYSNTTRVWACAQDTHESNIKDELIWWGMDGKSKEPKKKRYLSEHKGANTRSTWIDAGMNDEGSQELKKLLHGDFFNNPKPVRLLKRLQTIMLKDNDTILDFFSGSGTTAHALMEKNLEENKNNKFIMIQLDELTDERGKAYQEGYKTIPDIGKERIRRAGKKIKEDNAGKEGIEDLDIGFRVLKIDSSNMKDVYYTPDQMSQSLLDSQEANIKEDRTAEDLLFQVLLDWGVDLSLPITREEINGKTVYFVDEDTLVACFDNDLDAEFAKEIAKRKPLRAVFKESGYKQDEDKINIDQVILQFSPDTEVRAI
ncbi:MAG: site-specific DNA-methyltransferase [Sulfurimonas sp.]|nr:site-specific DNA-methyltransferase [Sulfurimonas sp.]